MHLEEVDRDRQRKDDSQRHTEGGQRQECTWKRWTETDRGRMTVRDIWRVDRDRHAPLHREEVDRDRQRKDDSQRHMEGGQRQACTWMSWTETDRGRMTVRDIWRVDRDRHACGRGGQRQTGG